METYEMQQGSAQGAGQFNEIKLTMLFLLRATEAKKKDHIDSFHLASNMKTAHPFDDIVFVYKKGGKSNLILLQAKHKENIVKHAINWYTLFKENKKNKDFLIREYLDGFVGMNLGENNKLKGPFATKEIILFTNAPLAQDEKELGLKECDPNEFYRMGDKKVGKIILDDDALNCLNLSSQSDINTEKIKDFLNSFRLAYDQPNHTDLESIIKKEISTIYNISQIEAETIYSEVSIKAQNWWLKPYFLNENNDWFDTSRKNLSQPSLSYAMGLMKSKLENAGIAYKSTAELEECIIHSVRPPSPKRARTSCTGRQPLKKMNKIINVVCDEKTKILSCVKVHQTLEKCFSKKYFLLLDDTSFDSVYSKVLEAFKGDCCLLAICSFRPIPNELIQIVSDTENKQIIWIGPAQSGLSNISLKVGFSHLTDEVRHNILKIPIRLQGELVPLVDLLDGSNCDEIITDDMLVDMVTGEVIVGRPLDGLGEVASYHISRKLKRKGSEELYQSDKIRPDDGNKFVLVSACPGMGKSTLVSSMMGERFHWKYRIDLIRHSKLLQNQQNMEALLFLKEAIVMSDYEYKLFKVAYEHKGGIVLFFDGFDEIAPTYKDKVLQLFQSLRSSKVDEVWVTTRPGFEEKLERELNTKAFHLEPFSRDKQKEFLKNIWKDSDDKEVERTLRKISNSTNDSGFTEIPLHLKMISEMSYEIISSEMDIFSLYEKFFRKKFYEVAKKGKLELDLSIPETKDMVDENYKIVWKKHEKMALFTLFDKYDLMQVFSIEDIKEIMKMMLTEVAQGNERNGVVYGIIDDKPAFTHRTYAEFFTASWMKKFFLENRLKKDFRQLRIFFYLYRYYTVRKFFDLSMCGKSEACKAVLTKDYRKLEEMSLDDLLKKDLAGRTAYHLSWVYKYDSAKDYLWVKKANDNSKEEIFKFTPSQHNAKNFGYTEFSDVFLSKTNRKPYLTYVFYENGNGKVNENLHWACANGEINLLENSIENGADVNKRDDENVTPLHLAAAFGHIEVMKVLIEKDALLNVKDRNGITPLHLALSFGKIEAAELLITQGADLKIKEGNTALHWAALMGNDCLVKNMIKRGADVNAQNNDGFTALHMAAREDRPKVVEILLSHGANQKFTNIFVGGPLMAAAASGHIDVVRALLCHGVDPNEICCNPNDGNSHDEESLWDFKEDLNFTDSPLLLATERGYDEVAMLLLNHGADPNVKNKDNETPLYHSILGGNEEMTEALLNKGADPHLKTGEENWSPISHAAYYGQYQIVEMLINRGARNELIENGEFLIRLAVEGGSIKLAKSLITWGAKIDPISFDQLLEYHQRRLRRGITITR